jgi:membrane protease YdiL (CAAX protease family)
VTAVPDQLLRPRADGQEQRPVRALLLVEMALVLGVSLGRSGVYAIVDLVAAATAPGSLSSQAAVLNGSRAPDRPWLDLTLQLLALGFGVVPVALAAYLLIRSGDGVRRTWLGGGFRPADLGYGAVLAAGVGGVGLAFYLGTHALGVDLTVVPEALPDVWWRLPVLVLSALQNALLEECVVVGFVLVRLRQLGVGSPVAIGLAAVLRGSYHLYQGFGGFAGNLVMGLLFGWLYQRWGRLTPLVVTHTLLDMGAFLGFALLAGHVSWLPT